MEYTLAVAVGVSTPSQQSAVGSTKRDYKTMLHWNVETRRNSTSLWLFPLSFFLRLAYFFVSRDVASVNFSRCDVIYLSMSNGSQIVTVYPMMRIVSNSLTKYLAAAIVVRKAHNHKRVSVANRENGRLGIQDVTIPMLTDSRLPFPDKSRWTHNIIEST